MKQLLNGNKILITVICVTITLCSCLKEGKGGKAMVSGKVFHHSDPIPNTAVYIKYGATEFPGADVTTYDNSIVADADGYFEFKDLRKGSYFLYGVGYDVAISSNVKGGVGIKLKNKEILSTNVPVTED